MGLEVSETGFIESTFTVTKPGVLTYETCHTYTELPETVAHFFLVSVHLYNLLL